MGEDGGQLRGKQLQGSKKERKKSTKTKGGKVEVMASFGILLHLAILCFFIKSKVHGKHFLIATEGDVGDGEGGDGEEIRKRQSAVKRYGEGGDGEGGDGEGGDGACGNTVATGNAVATGVSGVIKATARCVCHCPSPGNWRNNIVIAVAQCSCVCNGIEGPYGRCEEED